MARGAREKSNTGIYHVMLRGINRQIIFEDAEDAYKFISTLKSVEDDNDCNLYAYCLMDNHVHMLIRELDEDISTVIKKISASYVFWYNKKYERSGHLFQERFKSEVVETDKYFLTVLRYIHQNPIKAGMVNRIGDYKWSSYNEYIDKHKIEIVDLDFVLDLFSPNRDRAIELFAKYHEEDNCDKCLDYEDFINLTDEEVVEKISELGINIGMLQQMDKENRDNLLRKLKDIDGV